MANRLKKSERRILLIEPPFYRLYNERFGISAFPLSLGYLSGAIKKKTSWKVMAYNAEFAEKPMDISIEFLMKQGYSNYRDNLASLSGKVWEEVRATITEFDPDVIGITSKSPNFASAKIVAKLAKEISPGTTVIVGGPHPSTDGRNAMKCADIDICVRGEGDETIVELLHAIESGQDLSNISGIIFRKNGDLVETPPRNYVEDLDSLPFPHEIAAEVLKDYDKYPLTAFHRIFAIRGCPFNCSFCGSRYVWSRRPRYRSVGNVVRQIQALQQMGLTHIHFDDDTFGVNKQYIKDLCDELRTRCPGLTWGSEIHVNLVDKETITMMKSAGCNVIQLGIESGNNQILEQIRKGTTIEKALAACETIKNIGGIHLNVFFMVGFPQETEQTLRDTFIAMQKVKCDSFSFSIFTPYPGTELFELCQQKGLIGDDFDLSLYNHQSPNNYFSPEISQEKFAELVSAMARLVDKKNRDAVSLTRRVQDTMRAVRTLGLSESFRRLVKKIRARLF